MEAQPTQGPRNTQHTNNKQHLVARVEIEFELLAGVDRAAYQIKNKHRPTSASWLVSQQKQRGTA
eukprot:scaffold33883_cov216-Skeletonema_marinoi.AAC.3